MNFAGLGRDLNNIAKSGWDYISGVAKNISVEGMQKGWNTYMVQSSDELANVARTTMQRKNTVISNLNMSDFEKMYATADRSNAEYIKELNKLKSNLNSGNIAEAKTVATSISERFQDGAYLKLLQQAEGKHGNIAQQISSVPSELIKGKYVKDVKGKISENKIIDNFTTSEQQEKLATLAYRTQGKMPQHYFNSGDKKTNQIRAGVAGGAYLGGSMVVRGLQGGTPLTNEYGERDVAGIPFI